MQGINQKNRSRNLWITNLSYLNKCMKTKNHNQNDQE